MSVGYANVNGRLLYVEMFHNDNGVIKDETKIDIWQNRNGKLGMLPRRDRCLFNLESRMMGGGQIAGASWGIPSSRTFDFLNNNTPWQAIGNVAQNVTSISNNALLVDTARGCLCFGGDWRGLNYRLGSQIGGANGDFTIAVTIDHYQDSNVTDRQYIMMDGAPRLRLEKHGANQVKLSSDDRNINPFIFPPAQAGAKHIYAFTYDARLSILYCYMDGVEEGRFAFPNITPTRTNKIWINCQISNRGNPFSVKYYRIAVWDAILDAQQHELLANLDI